MNNVAISAVSVFLLLAVTAYSQRPSGKGLLPPVPKGPVKESTYRPEKPLQDRADGSFSRTVHHVEATPFAVEVRDLIVPPAKRITLAEQGAVVAAVQDGSGKVRQSGKASDITLGSVIALSEGAKVEIDNSGQSPLAIRIYLIKGQ